MGVLAITPTALPGPNAVTGVSVTAGTAAFRVTTGTDSYTIAATGTEILAVVNTTASPVTFTITGVADPQGRTGNYSMSVPGSAGLATVTVMFTPRLSQSLWAAGTPSLVTIPATVPAGLAVLALTGT